MYSGLVQRSTENEGEDGDRIVEESCPLLDEHCEEAEVASDPRQHDSLRRRLCVPLLFAIVAGTDFNLFMIVLPLTRAYESILCYRYFEAHEPFRFPDPASIPESLCKVEAIQGELAVIRGYEQLFMSLPGVFLALPYGALADRWGRKPVLSLSAVGIAMTVLGLLLVCHFWWIFPLRSIWIAWLLTSIGGGGTVMVSTALSSLTDIIPEASRAKFFLRFGVVVLTSKALATWLSSIMMDKFGITSPLIFGYSIGLLSCILTFLVPETLSRNKATDEPSRASEAAAPSTIYGRLSMWIVNTTSQMTGAIGSFKFLLKSPSLLAIVISFLMRTVGSSSIGITIQYSSKRFAISISDSGLLFTLCTTLAIFVFLFGLNFLGGLLERWYGLNGPSRDLWLARLMVLCAPFGFLLISLNQNIPLLAIGMSFASFASGCDGLMRSVATVMVHNDQVARVHAAISLVETLGILLAGPLMAEAFAHGLRIGGGWIVLPFALATLLTAFASAVVWLVRIPKATDSGA